MFTLLRRLWNGRSVPSRRKQHTAGQHHARPRLEPLEDRALQASLGSGTLAVALAPVAIAVASPPSTMPPASTAPIQVTVDENSSATVINLRTAFAGVSGLRLNDGLKLSILGNSNSLLVKPALSEAALSLTYARGKCGTATITVCATDADGVSVKQTVLVTVRPPVVATPVPASAMPARPSVAMAPPIPR